MRTKDYFDENGWFKAEYLWQLRKEITLGDLYVAGYQNSFGIKPERVCEFFTSFWEGYCEELAKEDGLWEQAVKSAKEEYASKPNTPEWRIQECQHHEYSELQRQKYDNEETLIDWYNCYDGECPLPPNYVNVDIHWDFARSIRVIAADEDEAESVVDAMMQNNEIPRDTFEPTDDYNLDLEYQP